MADLKISWGILEELTGHNTAVKPAVSLGNIGPLVNSGGIARLKVPDLDLSLGNGFRGSIRSGASYHGRHQQG